jgi:hypothetical protein
VSSRITKFRVTIIELRFSEDLSVYYKIIEIQDFNHEFYGNTGLLDDEEYYYETNAIRMDLNGFKMS